MQTVLLVHIAAGGLAILAGYAALFAPKGGGLHRRGGTVFVGAMVAMGLGASVVAAGRGVEGSGYGGLLVVYLVASGLATVRPSTARSRWLDVGLMLLALALGAGLVQNGLRALASPDGRMNGVPAAPILLNGVIALLAGASDFRVIRSGPPRGGRRLARHLWRMCFALFMATGSFFLGQADELPQALRVPALLAVPALLPLPIMFFWLWRVRARRSPGDAGEPRPPAARPRRTAPAEAGSGPVY